jgi:hypothetical protein
MLSMWGALSDERTGLLFTFVKISSTSSTIHVFTVLHVASLLTQSSKSPVPRGYLLFTVLHVILVQMCVKIYEGLSA